MRRRHWDFFESRVERSTEKILHLLEAKRVKATFFVLGWVAERRPSLIRRLAECGHEIASHGYAHELITEQTPTMFRNDVRKAKQILEDLLGSAVHGYRAPSFTITQETKWAISILAEEGYTYDSSIFPILHDRYGMPGMYPWSHQLKTDSGLLWEIPPSTVKLGGVTLPIAGGGYFRLFPYPILHRLMKRVETQGRQLVLYFHPWELDPEQPKMKGSFISRFRHYLNLGKTEERLARLLDDYQFGPIREVIAPINQMFIERLGSLVRGHSYDRKNGTRDQAAKAPADKANAQSQMHFQSVDEGTVYSNVIGAQVDL